VRSPPTLGSPVAFALAFVLVAATAPLAWAQDKPTLNGSWSATALSEKWAIGDWGEACGPKPRPQGAGAGSVQIREQGGELSIIGAGRAFSTGECWEQMPGLSRTSHSASGGGRFWRTRCNTPKNDPRQATIVTTISATDTTIALHETGQYQFVIQDQNCTASVTRSRNFSLVRREGDEAPAPSATASAAPTAAASAPPKAMPAPPPRPQPKSCSGSDGDPARLEVTPSRKLVRPGDKFSFRAAVFDGEGCPVNVRPTWSVAPGPLAAKATIDASGTLQIADDAGEGQLELVATVAGKGVHIPVEIASADNYDALLAVSGLNDAGELDEAAVAVIATGTIGGKEGVAEDVAKARKHTFIAIVGALAACLAFAGLVLLRRGRRARTERTSSVSLPDAAVLDETRELPTSDPPPPAASAPGAAAKKRGKICPTCGQRYPIADSFCGKDGTTLVPIN
jgi:hypothetical protein